MKITVLTICPEAFESFSGSHVIRRAESLGILELNIVDIRSYAKGSYRQIDDSPFGGGNGLILRCGPVLDALSDVLYDETNGRIRKRLSAEPLRQRCRPPGRLTHRRWQSVWQNMTTWFLSAATMREWTRGFIRMWMN